MKANPPIILTSTEDRNQILVKEFNQIDLQSLPLIQIKLLQDDHNTRLSQILNDISSNQIIAIVFSINAIESLQKIISTKNKERIQNADWAVVANRSEYSLEKIFPQARVVFRSENSTGAGLAQDILADIKTRNKTLIAFCAERGRPDFFDILLEKGYNIEKFCLYQTIELPVSIPVLDSLSTNSIIVFGSPGAVRAFFKIPHQAHKDFGYAVIGPTTANELRSFGIKNFYQSKQTDYRKLILEIQHDNQKI